ncbi:unnamed protein product [Penicillium salamii]|nr:unnamed protein product [Penicillium salamii]
MGQSNRKSFASYVSARDNVQSAFIGTPARNALLRLACNASLTRDVSAPNDLDAADRKGIKVDPDLKGLKEATSSIRTALLKKWGSLQLAKGCGDKRYQEFRRLQSATRTHRKRLFDAKKKKRREGFFEDIGNRIIEGNHQGKPVTFNPDLSHMQPERTALAELEFKNRDIDDVDATLLIEDRIKSLELRLQLNKLHVPKGLHKKLIFGKLERTLAGYNTEQPKGFNSSCWQSETGLECPFCLGCSTLDPAARQYSYCQAGKAQKKKISIMVQETTIIELRKEERESEAT